MRRLLSIAALLGFATLLACLGPQPKAATPVDACEYVYGACVLYAPDATLLTHTRIKTAFERAAQHWGDKPNALTGWTVVAHGYGPTPAFGGFLWGITFIDKDRLDFWVEYPRCPEVVFVHEWGHAASWASGSTGRPHVPGQPDDAGFDEAAILASLRGLEGC